MAYLDDITVINNAAASANWTASGFDAPTLNNSASTTPIFLEGTACMFWPLKKGITNGYTFTSTITGTPSMSGRVLVGFLNYPFADIDNIPITLIRMRMSSATGFTTNYAEWDALGQILSPENVPISGHTPIMGYSEGAVNTSGTPNYATIESVGWVATSGGVNDGKQGGFDWFLVISYVGQHSITRTNNFFSTLYDEYFDNEGLGLPGETSRPIGVLSQAGSFFQSNIRFILGHGTSDTANIVVSETGKTIFFNNLHINHSLGYTFNNPSGANELRFTLDSCVHFWNDQSSSTSIFLNPNNADWFQVTSCSFSRGGAVVLPTHTTNRYTRNNTFNACQEINVGDHDFTGNVVSGAVSGALYPVTGTLRAKNNSYQNCTDALRLTGTGPVSVTIDGDQFSGNTTDIHWAGTGQLTVNAINGANPTTSRVTGGGTVVIQNTKTVTVKAVTTAGANIVGARLLLEAVDPGPLPDGDTVTITRSGSTATVSHTAHGIPDGEQVVIRGANQPEYNGIHTITVTGANSYTYTVSGTPASPATGTINCTAVILSGLTDSNGEVSRTDFNYTSNQGVGGKLRKGTSGSLFKSTPVAGTIGVGGFSAQVTMVSDE